MAGSRNQPLQAGQCLEARLSGGSSCKLPLRYVKLPSVVCVFLLYLTFGSDWQNVKILRDLSPTVRTHQVNQDIPRRIHVTHPRSQVTQVNCLRLFQNSTIERQKSRYLMNTGTYISNYLSANEISNMTQNCATYITRRRYITESLTELEAQFPLAFSIVTYHDLAMTERLLRAIYRPQNYYCIHVDKKSTSEFYRQIVSLTECFPNVFLSNERADVHWGYIGALLAEIYCIRDLLKQGMWKYYINLTGEEFPLKTNLQLVKILQLYNGANEISNLPSRAFRDRWENVHILGKGKTTTLKSPPPHNISIHKGDVHAVITRSFASFAVTNPKAQDLLEWLGDAFCSDELFYASLQFNPHLKAPGAFKGDIGENSTGTAISRHKIWFADGFDCHGMWRNYICVYGIEDLPTLARDDHAFFINKLQRDFEPLAYDCLEELYFNRTHDDYMNPVDTDLSFYANQYFVKSHF